MNWGGDDEGMGEGMGEGMCKVVKGKGGHISLYVNLLTSTKILKIILE